MSTPTRTWEPVPPIPNSGYRAGKTRREGPGGCYSVNVFKGDDEIIAVAYGATEGEARRRAEVIRKEAWSYQL